SASSGAAAARSRFRMREPRMARPHGQRRTAATRRGEPGCPVRLDGGTLGFCYRFDAGAIGRRRRARCRAVGRVSEQTAIGKIGSLQGERAERSGPAGFSAGEALVQPALNRISIRGRVAQVEPKVMQVLVLMAERPGTVIPRNTFLDTVWAGTIADDYLLNRAVSELRKIFDDDPQAPRYIETIRKGGYRLVAPIAPARVAAALATPVPDASVVPGDTPVAEEPAVASPVPPAIPPRRGLWIGLGLVGVAVLALAALLLTRVPAGPAAGWEVAHDVR